MRTASSAIFDLIFGQTRGKLLALLYGTPEESFYIRQISREIDTSAGSVQRELAILTEAGLIERSVLGMQVFYKANREHPAFSELRALLAKTAGIFGLLKNALKPLASRIDFAFVYGSIARGEDNAASDIDLMIIGSVSLDEILDVVNPVEKMVRRPINPTIYSIRELRKRIQSGNHFLTSMVRNKKVFLVGDEDGFRQACGTRLVQG